MSLPLNQRRLVGLATRRSIPLDVSIELTHHCNFRCQHCYIPDFSAPDRLSTDRLLGLLEELADIGTLFLTLSGGELFLRKDWLTIAQRARRLGFALRLFSNGALIDHAAADAIRELPAAVEISLYALDAATFDTITQRPGSFEKTRSGIELLRERDIETHLKAPMMTLNWDKIDAIATWAEAIGATFSASPTIVAKKDGNTSTLALRIPPNRLAQVYGGGQLGCSNSAQLDPDSPLCAAASRYCNITSSGDVMACNILPGSDVNIREMSFREAWESSPWLQEIRRVRARDLATCSECSRLSYCGRCHAQALVEDGNIRGPSSYAQERADVIDELEAGRLVRIGV